jgi:hypothetical protein
VKCKVNSPVTDFIVGYMQDWREESGEKRSAREFNEGACFDIAGYVLDKVPSAKIVRMVDKMFPEMNSEEKDDFEEENDSIIHEFIEYDGKYFDAEIPCGVESIEQIPVLKRFRKK